MRLWSLQISWFVGITVQIIAFRTFAQTNFALHEEVIVSANGTCGCHNRDAFCSAVNELQHCRRVEFCDARCPYGESIPPSVDLVATARLRGEVTHINKSSTACIKHGNNTIKFNGSNGFLAVLPESLPQVNESQGLTVTLWLNHESGDKGDIITKEENSSVVFSVSADSINHEITLEYVNASGLTITSRVSTINSSLADGKCHHVAVVLFSSTIQLYLNGQLVAEESTYQDLWNRTGSIFIGGRANATNDKYFKGELGSTRLYFGTLLPSEIKTAAAQYTREPRVAPRCRCHVDYPAFSSDDEGLYCVNVKNNTTVRRLNENSHYEGFANDGDPNTWWQSKTTGIPVNLTVSLGGMKQVLAVNISSKWWSPKGMVLLRSVDNGSSWTPWQYYAQNCQLMFDLKNQEHLEFPDSVNCIEGFSNPVAGETVTFYLLEPFRPASNNFQTNLTLQEFSYASHVRLSMISFLGNSSEKTDYFAISEFEVYGRNCSCSSPEDVSTCQCEGSIIKPPECNETLRFDREEYIINVFEHTPLGVTILQVHAEISCSRSAPVSYFIMERNDSGSFELNNSTGVLKLQSYASLNSTYRLLIRATVRNSARAVNSTVHVTIRVIQRTSLNSRTTVDFTTKKLGFLQGERASNLEHQFGFFVNNYPSSEGVLLASVGAVTAQANYSTTREPAVHVTAVLVNEDVWYDRPAVRVIAQVQDSAFNVRTMVDDSEVVVKVTPSANLSLIDSSLLQVISKPSGSTGIAEIEVPLPTQWFSDPSFIQPEVVNVAYRLLNSNMPLTSLGNATIHPEAKTQLHLNDVYGVLPRQTVYIRGSFRFSIYCDSSYAIASFGIKLMAGSSLVIVGSQVNGRGWVHVTVNHSSSEWAVSATLLDPEAAPQGYVKRAQLVTFDVRVKDTAIVGTNTTLTAEVSYLSNINNEEVQIGDQPLPVMAAMIDGFDQSRHTVGTIHIAFNDVKQLFPYVEPSELVNTAVLNGHMVTSDIKLLAFRRSGDVTLLPAAKCESLSRAIQVTENCSKVFLNGSEPAGSAAAVVQVQLGNLTTNFSVRVWYPVLPLELSLVHPELAPVSGWLEFNASRGACVQRYQWSEVRSVTVFSYDGVQFENVSTTTLVRDLLTTSDESIAFVGSHGNVFGLSPGLTTVRAVNRFNSIVLGSVVVTVVSTRRVCVQLIDIVMVTNLSVSISSPPYPRRSTQMAVATVHQDLRRDHSRGSMVVCVTFSDGRRQQLTSDLGLRLRSRDEHVLRIVGQSEAISVGSGSGVLQADWLLPASTCYPKGFSLGVGYEVTNVSLSLPVKLEIMGVRSQITLPGDSSTIAGILTSSPIVVTLVFENGHRVDMSSDSRTVYDMSQSQGFFTVDRDANNRPMINANTQGISGKRPLLVRFTHFAISGSVEVNIVTYLGLVLQAKPYPPYPGSPLINTLSPVAGTNSFEMASLSLALLMSDQSKFDITGHDMTSFSFSSGAAGVDVGGNRVTVKSGASAGLAILEGRFGSVDDTQMLMRITNSPVTVTNITDLDLSPQNNGTLSGLVNSPVVHVLLGLTFSNGRRVTEFYSNEVPLFPGLITLTSEDSQIFAVDSSTGQITLRDNYHKTLSLTATAAVSMVTSTVTVACNLQPGVGDVDIGEESGLPLPPRNVDSSFQVAARLNAGGAPGVTKMDLTLSYDAGKLAVVSVAAGNAWSSCVHSLNSIGQISLDCDSDTALTGVVHAADITFNATSSGLTQIHGSSTTNLGTFSLVAGKVFQEILGSGLRRRRSLVYNPEAHKRRMRRAVFCAVPPCQCDSTVKPGDVNKDCLFDLTDILFVLRYYTFSLFNFTSAAGSLFLQSLASNQSRDLDVDRNTVVNPADAFYLIRANLGLIAFVSSTTVIPVQALSSECKLLFNVTLVSKDGPASDTHTFVFFDFTYRGVPVDFAGSTGTQRGVGIYGNVIRGLSHGGGSFSVQAPFDLVQNSIGFSVFHVTTDSSNGTSVKRSVGLVGSPRPPYLFPFKLSVDLPVADQSVRISSNNNYNPFLVFNNTLKSTDCDNFFSPKFEELVYHVNVSENATVNSAIVTVNATDIDTGKTGDITYSLVNDDALSVPFAVNSTSGVVYIVGSLDRERRTKYNLTVRATDGGAPRREKFAHAYVVVALTDVNDNAPNVTDIVPGHVIKVPENAVLGNPLVQVIASDSDVGENARLNYSIIEGSSGGILVINSTTGELTLNQSLHRKVGEVFKILVLVSDQGVPSLFVNTSVEIRVTYASDVDVFFTSRSYNANVTENSADNTSVVRVIARVPGLPSAFIVYSLSDNSSFKIGALDGIVAVNSNIDREVNTSFILTVIAKYGSNISTNATINVTVLDRNDNAPVPSPVPLQVVPFNLPVNSEVCRVNATDRDIGENAVLVFRLLQNVSVPFVIDEQSGVVLVGSSLLNLNNSFVQLSIEVLDSGLPPLSSNLTINISVLFPPRFSRNFSNISVAENVSVGDVLHTFTPHNIPGQDPEVLFAITSGNFGEKFAVRNSTGEVFVEAELDREQRSFYSLYIKASNLGVESFMSIQPIELNLNITVLDINDNAPSIQAVQPITVKNTVHVGYTLARVNASDADEGLNAQVQYRLTSGDALSRFVINDSGFLQLNSSLLFVKEPFFQLTINVSDLGSPTLYNTTVINITVVDDRSPPEFNQTLYNVSFSEDNPPGSDVVVVFASDPNGDEIHYNFSSQFPNISSIFLLNSTTGTITTLADLDRETNEVYRFQVIAYKSSPLTGEMFLDNATVIVRISDVNDVSPHFSKNLYTVEFDEGNLRGVPLITLYANDSDKGINSRLTYYIISGNESIFSINSSSGEVVVLRSLDYETVHKLNFTVQARDHGIPSLEGNATVVVNIRDLNDNTPTLDPVHNLTLLESVQVDTFVVKINASDADSELNSVLRFSIVDGNLNETFHMNSTTGVITTAMTLDFERKRSFTLNVTVQDRGTPPLSSSVLVGIGVIDVNDMRPVIQRVSPVYVRESVPVGTIIATLNATDGDSGMNAVLNFTIASGNQAGDFAINETTGVLQTAHALDHENVSSYVINVSVTDNGAPPLTSNTTLDIVVVDVNDHRPIFSENLYEVSIYENVTVNSTVVRVSARDLDSSTLGGLVYSIKNGNENGTFVLNSSSGEVALARELDFEETRAYLLLIQASDTFLPNETQDIIGAANHSNSSVSFTSYANVSVSIIDVNDNQPRFLQSFYTALVVDNLRPGSAVARVSATDRDSGENAIITYKLLAASGTELFVINSSSGELRTNSSLRDANYLTFDLWIRAMDGGVPSLNSTVILQVRIRYNVTYKDNETSPIKYSIFGALPVNAPAMLTRLRAETTLGLFSRLFGSVRVSVGNIQLSRRYELSKEPAVYIKAVLLSDWPDYQEIRIAAQVFDRFFNSKTAASEVYIKLTNSATNSEVYFNCVPSNTTGLCIGSWSIAPTEWLNSSSIASIEYGLSPSRLTELKTISLMQEQIPQIDNNFLLVAPVYLLHVGDLFVVQVHARFPKLVNYYTLLFTVSSGLEVKHVMSPSSWSVQTTSGPTEFAVLGIRKNNFDGGDAALSAPFFTITMEVTSIADVLSPEEMKCIVVQVSDEEGSQLIDGQKAAFFFDRFGRSVKGRFVVVEDEVKALFVVADYSIVINTALLTGRRVEIPLDVRGVTARGQMTNVTDNLTCWSHDANVLKVAADCLNVFVDGRETRGSSEIFIELTHNNITVNTSFVVWIPSIPISLDISPKKLSRIRDWYDPRDSCKSRYQQARVTARADFSNGKQTEFEVDVTQYVKDNFNSSDSSVAETVGLNVLGRNEGRAKIAVYVPELARSLGEVDVQVTNEDVRVYVLDVIVATRLSVALPQSLNGSLHHQVGADIQETFYIPEEEGSVVLSVQYSDGTVNTFDNLDGFFLNSTNNTVISVHGERIKAVSNESGNLINVSMHSGHCAPKPVINSLTRIQVSFLEPVAIDLTLSSSQITPVGDPTEAIGVPLSTVLRVALVYNVSGEEERVDVSNDSRTVYKVEIGSNLVNVSVTNRVVVVSRSSSGLGEVEISVRFAHVKIRGRLSMTVVGVQELKLFASPHPAFNASRNLNITQLNPIGNSRQHQQARLNILLLLSNGTSVDVSRDRQTQFEVTSSQPSGLAQKINIEHAQYGYHVLSVRWESGSGQLSIKGSFNGVSGHVLTLLIASVPVTVTGVELSTPRILTLKGVRDIAALQLAVNVEFSDNSKLFGLFSSGNTTLYDIVTFSTQDATKVSVNATTGLVTLKANSPEEARVAVTAVQSSLLTDSTTFACNLDPDVGDVDIGDVTGIPMKPARVGESFVASVRINSGAFVLGSFDVNVVYDSEFLEVVSVREGSDMIGFFIADVTSESGKVRIAGALSTESQQHNVRHVADVHFRVSSSGIARVTGVVFMVAADDLTGTVIGPPVPRDIVAGDVEVKIDVSVGRKRRSVVPRLNPHVQPSSKTRTARAVTPCPTPPCSSCPNGTRVAGDADGNCIFDIRDIKFTLTYMTEQQFNFSRPKGQQIQNSITPQQLQALDADGDGLVTSNDANLLLRANLKVISLSSSVEVVPVESPHSRCLLTISVSAFELGVKLSDANRTRIYFDVSHSDEGFSTKLQESIFTTGTLDVSEKGTGLHGGIILVAFNSVNQRFEAALNTSLIYPRIGLSLIQVSFASDGSIDYTRTSMLNGHYTQPPLYQGALNVTLDLGNGRRYSIKRPSGYNPFTFFTNSLASTNCSKKPLLEKDLSLFAIGARMVMASWKIGNVRQGLNFSFLLILQQCAQINEPCQVRKVPVTGVNHTVRDLSPYTYYSVKVETVDLPPRETHLESVRTLEAAPEGVEAPALQVTSSSSLNVSWTEPTHPNGVITSYSLHMLNSSVYVVIYTGMNLSYHVTGLTASQELFFYIMANTSAGGTSSPVASTTLPRLPTAAPRTAGLSVEVIVAIAVGSVAFIVILVAVVIFLVRRKKNRSKPRALEYSSLQKYHSLDANGRENFLMQTRSPPGGETQLKRGRMYEHHFSIEGLENPWHEQYLVGDTQHEMLAAVDHGNFDSDTARNENWDPGYEETVLREAVQEMSELETADTERRMGGFSGQQGELHHDNLVKMTRLSQSQSSLNPETAGKKKSKKQKEGVKPISEGAVEWDYYLENSGLTDDDEEIVETKSRGQIRKARLLAMEMLQRLSNGDVNREFRGLAAERTEGSYLCANNPVNLPKNRYKNILPFDHSRVTLMEVTAGQEGADYINANYLDGCNQQSLYIASQGPLDNTIADFWQMIWEQNVHVIVMLTRLQEGKKVKCVKYWPDAEEEVKFGDFVITSTFKRKVESRVIRRFILENTGSGESREINYFQFTAWPDFGIPSSPADFLGLFYDVSRVYKSLPVARTPMLVHCSAGIGRTGAFCTISNALQCFRSTGNIDVAENVRRLRTQRYGLVQTLEQYVFCYKCLVLALLYQIKLKKLRGTSLLSQSTMSLNRTGVLTAVGEGSSSPEPSTEGTFSRTRLQSPDLTSSLESVTSRTAPPYSYSQQSFPPVIPYEEPHDIGPAGVRAGDNDLPVVVVHPSPKTFRSKEDSLRVSPQADEVVANENVTKNPRNLKNPVGATGRRQTTGNIRRRPDLGEPPPPPPPPPSLPPNQNGVIDADMLPEFPDLSYLDLALTEEYDATLPSPPAEFCLAVGSEQPSQDDSTA